MEVRYKCAHRHPDPRIRVDVTVKYCVILRLSSSHGRTYAPEAAWLHPYPFQYDHPRLWGLKPVRERLP